jgi:hypothetical protein
MSFRFLGDGQYLVIVKRGKTALFFMLAHFVECVNNVEVIWDRRVRDRRSEQTPPDSERRATDRRQCHVMERVAAFLVEHDETSDSQSGAVS